MATKKSAKNSGQTARKIVGRPFKKGTSGNPKGRPMKGNSMAELIREIGDMTGDQMAERAMLWATDCRRLGVTRFKDALVLRMYLASMNEPTGAMCKVLLDRHDGLLPQPIAVGGDAQLGPIKIVVEYVEGEEAETTLGPTSGQE